jgi:hypothetical protein
MEMAKARANRETAEEGSLTRMLQSGKINRRRLGTAEAAEIPVGASAWLFKATRAEDIAHQRFELYAAERLADEWDTAVWEFWNHMLKCAEAYRIDHSGYGCSGYQADRDAARDAMREAAGK